MNKIYSIRKPKFVTTVIVLSILIALICGYLYFIHGTTFNAANTQTILIKQIKINNNNLLISGTTSDSSTGFIGYKYTIMNENLYLQLQYALVRKENPSGDFEVKINDNPKNVNKVYLQGNQKNDTELIWSR